MTTINEDMTAFVRYRLEKAEEAYTAAKILYRAFLDKVIPLVKINE